MGTSEENVAKLKDAFRRWDQSKGKDTSMWTSLMAPDVRLRSLAGGRPGLEFTQECHSVADVARYLEGLTGEWEMLHYKTEVFAVDGDRVVMLGSTSWRNKKTMQAFDTPKADLVTFRDGRIVEFFEFYDTEKLLAPTRG
jgi:ketosteroid isomerase-like protein